MKKASKWALALAIIVLVGILAVSSCDIVPRKNVGVKIHLEQVVSDAIQPGEIIIHAPFVTKIKTYSIIPNRFSADFPLGDNSALTSDKQELAISVDTVYRFDETRIRLLAEKYGDGRLEEDVIKPNLRSAIKAVVATHPIDDVVSSQENVQNEVLTKVRSALQEYPIIIDSVLIQNINWTKDYDALIRETAAAKQRIEKANREAEETFAINQKKVKEAEAAKQVAELEAERKKLEAEGEAAAILAKAQGEADAKKLSADATAYENQQIAQNATIMREQWRHEEEMERLKHWNGKQVSDVMVMTPAGTLTNVSGN